MVNHPTRLQSVGVSQVSGKSNLPKAIDLRPTILKRTEQDFIGAVLDELKKGGVSALTGVIAPKTSDEVLTFLQPVHRTFHIAVLEVVCNPYDVVNLQPRLDPRKIDSVGLVVRRLNPDRLQQRQGWRKQDTSLKGWINFETAAEENLDPDPTRRPAILTAGHPEIDRLLVPDTIQLSESVSPLYIAPPEVCEATGRTILYGVIPVTSPERSESVEPITYSADFVQKHLVDYLRPNASVRSLPKANQLLSADITNDSDTELQRFILMVKQLALELNAFGDSTSSKDLFDTLNQIQVTYDDNSTQPAGAVLKQAVQTLAFRSPQANFRMPKTWGVVSQTVGDRILQLAQTILNDRLSEIRPQEGRFDSLTAQYQIRAFIRVKRPDSCPSQLIWSEYSNPFTIAPWYANSGLPPVQVALPDVLADLKNLKPGVAFIVPPKLFNFLQNNDPKKLIDGEGNDGSDNGIAWICSFNIPIITLCAYIVLNIFLQLFNLIFQWIFFIKICIPFPKKLFPKQDN
jgi:hypothetical protein